MRLALHHGLNVCSLLGGLVVMACGAPVDSDAPSGTGDEDIASIEQHIDKELPGKADIVTTYFMGDAGKTRASYSVGRAEGGQWCSATMIGPNIMMTAAHCGAPARMRFWSYNGGDHEFITETFNCSYVLNTFPETDLLLAYCDPNQAGESPGIKYGYSDFELAFNGSTMSYTESVKRAGLDSVIYNLWWNPVDTETNSQILVSPGSITRVNTNTGWYNPAPVDAARADLGQCGDNQEGYGIRAEVYGAPGTSGSSIFSHANRVIAGPSSIANGNEGMGVGTMPIVEYLTRAVVQSPDAPSCGRNGSPMVNGTLLTDRWNLTADDFRGIVDDDSSGVFDVQEAIERVEGERQRSAYYFSFSSQRQNRLWSPVSAINTELGVAVGVNTGASASWHRFARHSQLNLKPGTQYHVTFAAVSNRKFAVCLGGSCGIVPTPADGLDTYRHYSFVLNNGGAGLVDLMGFGNGTTKLEHLAIVEMGATQGFSTGDERNMWSALSLHPTPVPRTLATILPLGTHSATTADWAGVVRVGTKLVNENLPFSPGRHRVCLDVLRNPRQPSGGTSLRYTVIDGIESRASGELSLGQNRCSGWFDMQDARGTLEIKGSGDSSLMIDNVRIE